MDDGGCPIDGYVVEKMDITTGNEKLINCFENLTKLFFVFVLMKFFF